jgi:hypothetical protein
MTKQHILQYSLWKFTVNQRVRIADLGSGKFNITSDSEAFAAKLESGRARVLARMESAKRGPWTYTLLPEQANTDCAEYL